MILLNIKTSKEIVLCQYLYFNHRSKFQKSVCNGSHDLLMMSPDINSIAIITVKGVDCRCIIYGVNKSDTIHLLENVVFINLEFIYNSFEKKKIIKK